MVYYCRGPSRYSASRQASFEADTTQLRRLPFSSEESVRTIACGAGRLIRRRSAAATSATSASGQRSTRTTAEKPTRTSSLVAARSACVEGWPDGTDSFSMKDATSYTPFEWAAYMDDIDWTDGLTVRTVRVKALGDKPFFCGPKPLYCDFNAFHALDNVRTVDPAALTPYPTLLSFMQKVEALPGVSGYLAVRPKVTGVGVKPMLERRA